MIKYTHKQQGFTLVEMMVYIGVVVLVSLGAVMTYISLDEVLLRNQAERYVSRSAEQSLERIIRSIRAAESVDVAMSTLGTSPGELVLDDGTVSTSYYVSGGRLVVAEDGNELGPLTGSEVTVQDVTFWHTSGSRSDLVRIELVLTANNRAASTTRAFYTSALVKGTYE